MATSETPTVGLAHTTVVPANFDPDEESCQACGSPSPGTDRDRRDA